MLLNPYIAGNPIKGEVGFYGRDDIFRSVMQVLRHPNSNALVLFGQRRIGKTSVLLQLERQLDANGEYTPVYFDLQDKAAKSLTEVLYELAQRIATKVNQPLPDRKSFDQAGEYFRNTFLPLAAVAAAPGGIVLLFDEFDVLDSPDSERAGQEFFPYLRDWMSAIQRVKFVFVIGRRPEDLSTKTMSTLKGVGATRVSLLERKAAEAVVRQSERNGSLLWSDSAVEKVWEWTQGHTYFTQLLCSVAWENAQEEERIELGVQAADVEGAVEQTMQQGANAFQWIWSGLPPAERVVMGAMAESEDEVITPDNLVEILNRSGVRLMMRELQIAPETLANWELLRPIDQGHRFVVPFFRLWVKQHYPLRRVKEELDRIDPLADNYYRIGQSRYRFGQLEESRNGLEEALKINPNHLGARLLLGRILLETHQINEAIAVLEEAFLYDAGAARSDLVRALLIVLELAPVAEQLAICERILGIEPNQPIARDKRRALLMTSQLQEANEKESAELWEQAIVVYTALLEQYPDATELQAKIEHAQKNSELAQSYNKALGALQSGNKANAKRLLAGVIAQQPDYKESARYLLRTTTGHDVEQIKDEVASLKKEIHKGKKLLSRTTEEAVGKIDELEKQNHELKEVNEKQKTYAMSLKKEMDTKNELLSRTTEEAVSKINELEKQNHELKVVVAKQKELEKQNHELKAIIEKYKTTSTSFKEKVDANNVALSRTAKEAEFKINELDRQKQELTAAIDTHNTGSNGCAGCLSMILGPALSFGVYYVYPNLIGGIYSSIAIGVVAFFIFAGVIAGMVEVKMPPADGVEVKNDNDPAETTQKTP